MRPISVMNLTEENGSNGSPPAKMICKFVILVDGDQLHLVFGLLDNFPYHAHLVNQFCIENDVAAELERKPDLVRILESKYDVRGGGWMEIDKSSKQMKFFGRSTAYGQFDPVILGEILRRDSFFGPYHITVRH